MASRGKHTAQHSAPRARSHGARGTRQTNGARPARRERPATPRGAHSAGGAHSASAARPASGARPAAAPRPAASRGAHSVAGSHYRRSSRRRRKRLIAGIVSALAVAALAVGAVSLSHVGTPDEPQSADTSQQSSAPAAFETSDDPAAEYAHVVMLVNQADRTVVPLSRLVSKTVTDSVAKRMDEVVAGRDSAGKLLDEASSRLAALTPKLSDDAACDRAATLSDAVAARKDMLTYGCVILQASSGAHRASGKIVRIWQGYIGGHEDLQTASEHVASGTTADVKKALRHDRRAGKRFGRAAELVEEVQQIAPNADLSVERKYAALQVKAAKSAVSCDKALLEEDERAARKHNAAYGRHAAAAAKAAKSLPATTDDLVKSVYYSFGTADVSVQDAQNRYEKAAKRAAKDDKKLAGSSGSSSKGSGSSGSKKSSKNGSTSKEK